MLTALDLCGPDYYIQESDVALLQKYARLLPPYPRCVNIGAAYGTSALALLESRPDSYVISIDKDLCPAETEHLRQAGYQDSERYLRVLGDSAAVGRAWPWHFGRVDLVFVDGGHLYRECYADLRAWYPHLRPGGYLLIHDYAAVMLAEVKPAVDDFAAAHRDSLRQVDKVGKLIVFQRVP